VTKGSTISLVTEKPSFITEVTKLDARYVLWLQNYSKRVVKINPEQKSEHVKRISMLILAFIGMLVIALNSTNIIVQAIATGILVITFIIIGVIYYAYYKGGRRGK